MDFMLSRVDKPSNIQYNTTCPEIRHLGVFRDKYV